MSEELKDHYEKVYRYCYFRVHDRYTAEDLTQEAFLRYFAQNTYIHRGKKLAYLYTIAHNLCVDYYRKGGAAAAQEFTEEVSLTCRDDWEEWTSRLEDRVILKAAVDCLPKEQQEIIMLRYANELSVGEIAQICGLSRFAVYRREKEALRRLCKSLGGD